MDADALKATASDLWDTIVRLETEKYDLEEWSKKHRNKMKFKLWDQKFQGNRFIVLDEKASQELWWTKQIDLVDGRQLETGPWTLDSGVWTLVYRHGYSGG